MLVLTWNLFHGRAQPCAGRPLLVEFASALAGWEWDVALLQEVPPWWPATLAEAAGATFHARRTARNEPLAPRRAIARRNPDLLGANGGGANAILVRGAAIGPTREHRLTWRPERRWVHAVRLEPASTWVANLHASTHPQQRKRADIALARDAALAWANGAPLVLGGDFNALDPALGARFTPAATNGIDHLTVANGLAADGERELLDAGELSDHLPLRVRMRAC